MVPWFVKLAEYTQDHRWGLRAKMMWSNVLQAIAEEDQPMIHGLKRPVGSQNEAFFHCNWGKRGQSDSARMAGMFNDWLVAWPGAFRLDAIAEMEGNGTGGSEGIPMGGIQ